MVHACIPKAMAKMVGIKALTIGYTKDIELAERVAGATGAKELIIETRPEGDTLMLDEDEQAEWRKRGWRLEGRTAKKTLVTDGAEDCSGDEAEKEDGGRRERSDLQPRNPGEEISEPGRLTASMIAGYGE